MASERARSNTMSAPRRTSNSSRPSVAASIVTSRASTDPSGATFEPSTMPVDPSGSMRDAHAKKQASARVTKNLGSTPRMPRKLRAVDGGRFAQ
jgi:hypothetical protein